MNTPQISWVKFKICFVVIRSTYNPPLVGFYKGTFTSIYMMNTPQIRWMKFKICFVVIWSAYAPPPHSLSTCPPISSSAPSLCRPIASSMGLNQALQRLIFSPELEVVAGRKKYTPPSSPRSLMSLALVPSSSPALAYTPMYVSYRSTAYMNSLKDTMTYPSSDIDMLPSISIL